MSQREQAWGFSPICVVNRKESEGRHDKIKDFKRHLYETECVFRGKIGWEVAWSNGRTRRRQIPAAISPGGSSGAMDCDFPDQLDVFRLLVRGFAGASAVKQSHDT